MTIKTLKSTCLCGNTHIEVTAQSCQIGACHCAMCRKWSGGPFMGIESEQVTVSGDNIVCYPSSEWAERAFCRQCGTHLFYRLKDNNVHYVPVGLFDENDQMTLSHEIFIDSKPHYYHFAEDTHKMTGAEVFAAFEGEKP
ncbi:MAG: aldehyde-activating protein [Alteromonas sp. TMED35]|nr:aldehyde-activating protein [Alteromonadaceae bacterium]OUX90258.1 MAG: aldehyde-activating protein [Alteromonas sp. TMED35]